MPATRRQFLQLVGASSAALAVGCGVDSGFATAVLDPEADSVIVAVWSRLSARDARVVVSDGGRRIAEARLPLRDGIARGVIGGLAPGSRYDVAIAIGERAAVHRVRTAPHTGDSSAVRIAIIADADPSPEFASSLVDTLCAAEPDLVISIGDFPYTDNGPPARTVAQYRERHVELRNHPPIRSLLETCGLYAIYDDHEFRNDWDAQLAAAEPARYAAAMQVWDEFFPQRAPAGEIRYRSWRWGAQLECFLLDCRRFRSANAAPDDAAKTMLGAPQLAWLINGVTASSAAFKLVLTSVPLDFGRGDDHWAAYTTERDAMFAALVGVPGVVFASADQHWFAAHRHARGIREFQIGPLARGLGEPVGAPPGVLFRAVRYNAGVLDVDGAQLTFRGFGEDGEFYRETLTLTDLTPA